MMRAGLHTRADAEGRGPLREIFGGSLEQIASSLQHLPLSVARARPSHDAHVMLRSKGYADLPAFDVSSLHMQPRAPWADATGAAGTADMPPPGAGALAAAQPPAAGVGQGEEEEIWAGDYSEVTAAIKDRVALLSRLHTENFLKEEAEREWEEEMEEFFRGGIGLSSVSHPNSSFRSGMKKAGGTTGKPSAGGGVGWPGVGRSSVLLAPVAGFSEMECGEFHGVADEVEQRERRWREDGRFMRLFDVVLAINNAKWNPAGAAPSQNAPFASPPPHQAPKQGAFRTPGRPGQQGSTSGERDNVMPLLMLSQIAHASYDYHEPSSNLVRGTPVQSHRSHIVRAHAGDGPVGSHWYLCELYRMLHQVVSRGRRVNEFRKACDGRVKKEGWLTLGALEYLNGEFRSVLAQVHNDRMEHERSMACGDEEDLIYVRNHLLRYPHTCQFPREWHVDEFPMEEGQAGSSLQVPLWAEIFFLMRCGSDKAANLLNREDVFRSSAAGRGGFGAQEGAEAAFYRNVRSIFAEALKQWAGSERAGNGEGLHKLNFTHAMPKTEFLRVCTMRQDGDAKDYHAKHHFRQATGQDVWHKAVISVLNDTEDNPGDFPFGDVNAARQGSGRSETHWTKRAINELPPLLGDPGEHLCVLMGRDAGCDRLMIPEFLVPHPQIKSVDTAMLLQKSLWRLVQDYLWRQLVFVRPGSAFPVLSLEHCRCEGVRTVIDRVSKILPSFKVVVKAITACGNVPDVIDPRVKTIVSYNLVQMLFLTLQLEKGLVELASLGGVHLAEATHAALALAFYMNPQEQAEAGSNEASEGMHTLVFSLISKYLHAYILPIYSGVGRSRASLYTHMKPQAQVQRAIHYCLLMQEVPQGHPSNMTSPRSWVAEEADVNPYAVELVAQVALAVPAREFHRAAWEVVNALAPAPPAGPTPASLLARRSLLRCVLRLGRIRAAEICREKGDLLLKDAAMLYYWADYHWDPPHTHAAPERLQLDHYLQTVTALMDLYANPKRKDDRAARKKVLKFCGDLVQRLYACAQADVDDSSYTNSTQMDEDDLEGEGGLGEQARDVMIWLRSCDTSSRNRTYLAVFLHTWQAARAHDVLVSGMHLDALRELYDLPAEGGRQLQFAPLVRTLLQKAVSPLSARVNTTNTSVSLSVTNVREAYGNVSFLPCQFHNVTAEQAVAEAERIYSVFQGSGFTAARNLVSDCILLAVQCFVALKRADKSGQHAMQGGFGSGSGTFTAEYSSMSVLSMMSPSKRKRADFRSPQPGRSPVNVSAISTASSQADTNELLKSIDWHLEELQRLVELLEARSLCPKDLGYNVKALLSS